MRTRRRQREGAHGSEGQPSLLRLYRACLENARDLAHEACLLYRAKRYPRAYALAFTALEEISKSQAVADFFTGVLSHPEFEEAFRNHKMKTAYLDRVVVISASSDESTVEYDQRAAESRVMSRMRALYVDYGVDHAPAMPGEAITREHAKAAIDRAESELHEMWVHEEYYGHQIGTKGLWK